MISGIKQKEVFDLILSNIKKTNPNATLLAVSKGQPIESLLSLYQLGHRDFAENYSQELIHKIDTLKELAADIRWHFIGPVQSNKISSIAPYLSSCHSIDREKIARLFSEARLKLKMPPLPCFVQVNIDQEPTKSGIQPEDAKEFCKKISNLKGIQLVGLMCIPSSHDSKSAFHRLKVLETQCQPYTMGKLSMGMTGDYLDALKTGATHIRIGTLLFGERKTN